MTMITDTAQLTSFCEQLAQSNYITVDTEFLRESTYWPKLCLVQLANEDVFAAVDVLAEGIDLTPLFDLMRNSAVLKVFHSARQDLEIFHLLMGGDLPAPLFDTQIAAMVCGFGDSVGYDNLARKLINVEIDKSARFTDWSKRPLTEKQINYALSDVTFLRDIYKKLQKQISSAGREHWLTEEMAILESPATYVTQPEDAYKRMKTRSNDKRYLTVLRELAAWREAEAQRKDMPRGRVLKDEQLFDIAAQRPRTPKELAKTRGISEDMARGRIGKALLEAVETALSLPKDQQAIPKERIEVPAGRGAVSDLLKVLLKQRCDDFNVAQKLICNSQDLDRIAADQDSDIAAMHGWRYEVFGEVAQKLKKGELSLHLENGQLVINTR
ncbi:ribonuclease D [Kiloniella sp. b19]|uniref:ribonuclease D n=1 Tax=Kiloniella sp. GXU_MW_B19 TaxID=3141326 RepID=UPI0031CEBD90